MSTQADHSANAPCIAIIPARGGSKGLPGKNILEVAGKPLIGWSIDAASAVAEIDRIIVSTDCPRIAETAKQLGTEVVMRPPELATDDAPTWTALAHVIGALALPEDTLIVLLQPTSPLRTAEHIREGLAAFQANPKADCLLSLFEPPHHPGKAFCSDPESGFLTGMLSPEAPFTPRQQLPRAYMPNGALYIFRAGDLLSQQAVPRQRIIPYIMSEEMSHDVDTLEDVRRIERLLGERK